jgi:hypothetical protein
MLKLVEPVCVDEKRDFSYPAEYSIEVKPSNIDERLLLFDIPGQGNKTKSYCGHVSYAEACPSCKMVHPHDYHCKNYACPVCYPFASLQGAERAASKINGVHLELREMGINPGYMNHIMISLPDDRFSDFLFTRGKNKGKLNFEKLREYFYQCAQEIGIVGGFLAIHPGRCKDEFESGLLAAQELYGEEHPRIWKGIQDNVFEFDNWREYVDFGIHVHIVGFFKMKETSDEFHKRTGGCTYKNITVEECRKHNKPVKPENFESMKAIITYELGHHAYRKGKHGITPFGIIKDWTKVREGTDYIYKKCGECETDLVQISTHEYENFLLDKNSVDLENKMKVLRSKPVIRYLLRAELRDGYLKKYKKGIAEDKEKSKMIVEEEKVRVYLDNKRKGVIKEDPPVKSPVKKFMPYKVKKDYVSLRIACVYKVRK